MDHAAGQQNCPCGSGVPPERCSSTAHGRVWLQGLGSREPEIVFAFPFHEQLNAAVKRVPGRWFDWRRKHWRIPADRRRAPEIETVLACFPALRVSPEVHDWLHDAHRWRALVSVTALEGEPVFLLRTLSGELPPELPGAVDAGQDRMTLPLDGPTAERLITLEGAQLDDPARESVEALRLGAAPAGATLGVEIGFEGEPELVLTTRWDAAPAFEYARLPEAQYAEREGRFFIRGRAWGVGVPADPANSPPLEEFLAAHPGVAVEESARELLGELRAEHDRARDTVELSYAHDADLGDLRLGGVLRPFQR